MTVIVFKVHQERLGLDLENMTQANLSYCVFKLGGG